MPLSVLIPMMYSYSHDVIEKYGIRLRLIGEPYRLAPSEILELTYAEIKLLLLETETYIKERKEEQERLKSKSNGRK